MKHLLLALLTFVTTLASAQTITVKYYRNPVINNRSELQKMPQYIQEGYAPNRHSYTLTYSKNKSFYGNYEDLRPETDSVYIEEEYDHVGKNIIRGVHRVTKDTTHYNEMRVFADFTTKRMQCDMFNLQAEDNLVKFDWKISPDTLTVAGYKCQKATAVFFGSPLTAWFTKEIPVSSGPYMFQGLPGLILKVELKGAEFVAYEVNKSATVTPIAKLEFKGKVYTFEGMAAEVTKLNKIESEKPLPANARKVFKPE